MTIQPIGHTQAIQLLNSAINQQKIATAYRFYGPQGIGKYTTAQWFAKEILGNSFQSTHPDLLYVSPLTRDDEKTTSSLPTIKVEQIREVDSYLSTAPIYAPFKVVIIDDAGTMTPQASNALLKTLEEPGRGRFVLIHHSHQALLPTIESRCQKIPFYRLSPSEASEVLEVAYELELDDWEIYLLQGCPGLFKEMQHHLALIPTEVRVSLQSRKANSPSFELVKQLAALERHTQIWLASFLQNSLWNKCQNTQLMGCFELGINQLKSHCNAVTVWSTLLGYWDTSQGQVTFPNVIELIDEEPQEPDVVFIKAQPSSNSSAKKTKKAAKFKATDSSNGNNASVPSTGYVQRSLL